jgi:uncharacterized protein (TIGR03437 family)
VERFEGAGQMSPNGRYIVTYGTRPKLTSPGSIPFRVLHDRQTGESIDLPARPSAFRQAVTNSGTVYLIDDTGTMQRWRRSEGLRSLDVKAVTVIVSDNESWLIYEQRPTNDMHLVLHSRELASGRDFILTDTTSLSGQLAFGESISKDGKVVTYLAAEPGEAPQLYASAPDGTNRRKLTSALRGIDSDELSGAGNVVFARGLDGLAEIDLVTAQTNQIFSFLPSYSWRFSALVPGTAYTILGTHLSKTSRKAGFPLPTELEGVRVTIDGEPVPLISVSPTEVQFQAPWELTAKIGQRLFVEIPNDSPYDNGGGSLTVQRYSPNFAERFGDGPIAAHQDFSALLSEADPARPGEIVHFYAGGLGPVTPSVATGEPTPPQPHPTGEPLGCTLQDTGPAEVLYAGLAPEMVGFTR